MICDDLLQEQLVRYLSGRRMLGGDAALQVADVARALDREPEAIAAAARTLAGRGVIAPMELEAALVATPVRVLWRIDQTGAS